MVVHPVGLRTGFGTNADISRGPNEELPTRLRKKPRDFSASTVADAPALIGKNSRKKWLRFRREWQSVARKPNSSNVPALPTSPVLFKAANSRLRTGDKSRQIKPKTRNFDCCMLPVFSLHPLQPTKKSGVTCFFLCCPWPVAISCFFTSTFVGDLLGQITFTQCVRHPLP